MALLVVGVGKMDCLCSVLASIANSVVQAVAAADARSITTDMGDPSSSSGFEALYNQGLSPLHTGTLQGTSLATTHVAALFILLTVALIRVLMTQGTSQQQAFSRNDQQPRKHDPPVNSMYSGRRDDNDGGESPAH